ncbi:Signal transduction histidine kinase [Chitinophaga jiangningensis]|uniref:histidine kinase n=1 Tax=Chitinophaga jiangningensis TaxID=1419482 RepID=A0A1M6W4B4_9BACT|nr:HAMP domain-containing histidine kinase [Chitinophaga jiangningensis]SHK88315.1 Signal transduction histidine kinase [Chitinophaga jiangningensis]
MAVCLLLCITAAMQAIARPYPDSLTRDEIYRLAQSQDTVADSINYLQYLVKERAAEALARKNVLQRELLQRRIQDKKNTQLLTIGVISVAILLLVLILTRYYHFRNSRRQEQQLARGYAEISEKNAELKATDDFKNKLITIIANDFREPLLHITDVAEKLERGGMSRQEMLEEMEKIGLSSHKTLDVFDYVLRWIQLQLAGYTYTPVTCRLREMMNHLADNLSYMSSSTSPRVVDRIPDDATVLADAEMLQFVLRQILLAAYRHGLPGSLVIADAWPDDNKVRISIALDAGEAAMEVSESLFAWQRDTVALGMAVSRDFAVRMQGDIQVEASAGRYITISLILPK